MANLHRRLHLGRCFRLLGFTGFHFYLARGQARIAVVVAGGCPGGGLAARGRPVDGTAQAYRIGAARGAWRIGGGGGLCHGGAGKQTSYQEKSRTFHKAKSGVSGLSDEQVSKAACWPGVVPFTRKSAGKLPLLRLILPGQPGGLAQLPQIQLKPQQHFLAR